MQTEIKVDKDIPMPPRRKERRKWPFDEMNVGDSFFAPEVKAAHFGPYARRLLPKRFTTRTVTENDIRGIRVWRFE